MDITPEQVRAHRLRAHHLDRRYPASRILEAAGACGLQNSPPGGWETALFQRLEGCSRPLLRDALYPVSYTHLDVYKRQEMQRMDRGDGASARRKSTTAIPFSPLIMGYMPSGVKPITGISPPAST